ncbi:MAG: preprotein translocase subunit YajC [Acidobacteriota bacterium]
MSLFLFAQQKSSQPSGSVLAGLLPFILVFIVFYLLLILPARKRQKKHQQMIGSLKPGDKVITTGGIYGVVMGVHEDKIELRIATNVKIDIAKNAISGVLGKEHK